MIELESPTAEVPQSTATSGDTAGQIAVITNYLVVNTVLLQTVIRDLEILQDHLNSQGG